MPWHFARQQGSLPFLISSCHPACIPFLQAAGAGAKSALELIGAGVKVAKEGYEVAAPVIKQGVDAVAPVVNEAYKVTAETAGPLLQRATPLVQVRMQPAHSSWRLFC